MPFVIVVRADGATWDGKEWVEMQSGVNGG